MKNANSLHPDQLFHAGDMVVYPSHGVGEIDELIEDKYAGQSLHVYVMTFRKDKLKVRLPVDKAHASGLRSICSRDEIIAALQRLKQPMKKSNQPWNKRMAEYELKITSGTPMNLMDVVVELNPFQKDKGEQSYSERRLYQDALSRLAEEIAVIEEAKPSVVIHQVEQLLKKSMA